MSVEGTVSGKTLRGKAAKMKETQGYSAYEIAVINGFDGTEEEWLASLKGEKGDAYTMTDDDYWTIVAKVTETEGHERQIADEALWEHIVINDKRIANLEQGLSTEQFVVDDSVAYVKDIPANACQYALVNHLDERVTALRLQGANAIPNPYYAAAQSRGGMEFEADADGRVTCNGTAAGAPYFVFQSSANKVHLSGTYYVSGLVAGVSLQLRKEPEGANYTLYFATPTITVPEGDYSIRLFVANGVEIHETLAVMLNKASAELPFSPYKDATEIPVAVIANDSYIEVEGGGTITMVNENAEDVASEIVYQLRG